MCLDFKVSDYFILFVFYNHRWFLQIPFIYRVESKAFAQFPVYDCSSPFVSAFAFLLNQLAFTYDMFYSLIIFFHKVDILLFLWVLPTFAFMLIAISRDFILPFQYPLYNHIHDRSFLTVCICLIIWNKIMLLILEALNLWAEYYIKLPNI